MKGRLVAAMFCACSSPALAGARPSLWDLAENPQLEVVDRTLRAALRARTPRDIPAEIAPAFDTLLSLRAATLIELAGGAALPSAELQLFLADSLIASESGREKEGRAILRSVLERIPEHPLAARAWFTLAIAANRSGDFAAAKAAYDHALSLEWSAEQRARIYMNRAEEKMSLGRLKQAERDFELALGSSSESDLYALANWGQAVALARQNELPRALERVRLAASVVFRDLDGKPIFAIELPGVFYTPDYEINYYRALAFMARAEDAGEPEDAERSLDRALDAWQRYLEGARTDNDKWVDNVERHVAWCERKLARIRGAVKPPSERRSRARSD